MAFKIQQPARHIVPYIPDVGDNRLMAESESGGWFWVTLKSMTSEEWMNFQAVQQAEQVKGLRERFGMPDPLNLAAVQKWNKVNATKPEVEAFARDSGLIPQAIVKCVNAVYDLHLEMEDGTYRTPATGAELVEASKLFPENVTSQLFEDLMSAIRGHNEASPGFLLASNLQLGSTRADGPELKPGAVPDVSEIRDLRHSEPEGATSPSKPASSPRIHHGSQTVRTSDGQGPELPVPEKFPPSPEDPYP